MFFMLSSCVLCYEKHRRGFHKDAMPVLPKQAAVHFSVLPRALMDSQPVSLSLEFLQFLLSPFINSCMVFPI